MSTKLKLLGVDVASFGDAFAAHRRRAQLISFVDTTPAVYKKLVDRARQQARCSAASWSATPSAYGQLLAAGAERDRRCRRTPRT